MTAQTNRRLRIAHDRGEYRSYYAAMIDDSAFIRLSGGAFKLYFILRQTLGAAGIGILRPLVLAEQMAMKPEALEPLLDELETRKAGGAYGWIIREENVVWIVDALRDEPTIYSNNEKHRPFVQRLVLKLGDRRIVQAFRDHYPEWFVATDSTEETDTVSDTVSRTVRDSEAVPNRNTKTKTSDSETNDINKNGNANVGSALRVLIERFIDRYYSASSSKRRESVRAELEQLADGKSVPLGPGLRIQARSTEQLARVLREVIEHPPRVADKAIAVVLRKLTNLPAESHGRSDTESASVRMKAEVAREDGETQAAVRKWIEGHATEYALLEREAAELFPATNLFNKAVLDGWLIGAVTKAMGSDNQQSTSVAPS